MKSGFLSDLSKLMNDVKVMIEQMNTEVVYEDDYNTSLVLRFRSVCSLFHQNSRKFFEQTPFDFSIISIVIFNLNDRRKALFLYFNHRGTFFLF